jgi:hypothetical protein
MGVAEELEEIAMEVVGPGLGDDVDDAACEAAVLGIYIARQDAKLCDGVEVRDDPGLLADSLLHACSVEIIGVVGLALSVNGELPGVRLACGGYRAKAATGTGVASTAGSDRGDTRLDREQVCIASTIERNIDHLLIFDGLSDLRIGGADLVFSITLTVWLLSATFSTTSIVSTVFTSIFKLVVCR